MGILQVRVRDMAGDIEVETTADGAVLWLRSGMMPVQRVCQLGVALEHFERAGDGNSSPPE